MNAIICLLLPPLLVGLVKDRYERSQEKILERATTQITYMLIVNSLTIFIFYILINNNYGQLVSALNQNNNFACKYFALAMTIALMTAFCDRKNNSNPDLKQNFALLTPYIYLFLWFLVLSVFLNRNIDFLLDSDMSSEMILANLLAKEKAILSKEWFYSTELRVLNTQLVFTPLFWLLTDWHVIRVTGSILCWIFLLASYYYLCRQLDLKRYFAISGICLILPLSNSYARIVIEGLYYIPHISITFFTFGLIFQYAKSEHGYSKIALLLLVLLSIVAGMGGPRQLLILYIPLILTDVILYYSVKVTRTRPGTPTIRRFFIASLVGSLFSVIGYLVNTKVLSKIYTYKNWGKIRYKDVSVESFMKVVNGILNFFGYQTKEVFSFTTVMNLFCCFLLALVIIIVYHGLKRRQFSDEYYISSLYYLVSVIVFVLLYSVTNTQYIHRYNIPILIFTVPLVVLGLENAKWPISYKKIIGKALLVGMILCCGNNFYQYFRKSSEQNSITQLLLAKGYREGYASFWNGNILTELSDGKIDMRVWGHDSAQKVDQIYKWLQLKQHVNTVPKGPVFVLLSTNQFKKIKFYTSLDEKNIIYKTKNYVAYGYESYKGLIDDIKEDSKNEK